MQQSPASQDTLFVPVASSALRRGRSAGFLILVGALAVLIGSCLPWQVLYIHLNPPRSISVLDSFGSVTVLLGTVALIAGISMLKRPTYAAWLFAGISSLIVAGIGGYYLLREIHHMTITTKVTAIIRVPYGFRSPIRAPGIGLYILGLGVVLIMAGVVLNARNRNRRNTGVR